jgi:diguanylate cyclase (GGDEF)-like protein
VPDVTQRVADALPALSGGRGAVYLWDGAAGRLVFGACDPGTDGTRLPKELVVDNIEGAAELLGTGEAVFLDADVVTGDLLQLLESTGVAQAACLPVVARGDFLGLVTASFEQRIGDDERSVLIERLAAFADQAATALDNARLLERARHQATHDELTGLPNRPMLEDRANQALAGGRRRHLRPTGLLFIDLDRFKNVNDTLGHHAGDDLIRQVAERLAGQLRAVDTLARLGGDEFVALLPDLDGEADAVAVAERLIHTLDAPFHVAGTDVFVSCSIGIAVAAGGGTDYTTLLQHADAAMYEAKAAGSNTCVMHHRARDSDRQQRLELESALHGALGNGELAVVYQPQVDLRTGGIIGAEALVRWDHPVFGTVSPEVFIPIAEEAGLILEIDRWVRLTALAQMRVWRDAGLAPLRLSFNLSTRELHNPYLPLQLAGDLAAAGVDASWVELEITERVVMADDDGLVTVLEALRAVGVRLAIDDFGTGSSVLRRLQRHPVDTLKIDRSFIGDITATSSGAVVAALLQMGASLGIEVLAEGVETEEQRAQLLAIGCRFAQGYLFSRPVSADVLRAQLVVGSLAGALLAPA